MLWPSGRPVVLFALKQTNKQTKRMEREAKESWKGRQNLFFPPIGKFLDPALVNPGKN